MNEFDLQLESELRLFLDPITAAPAPPRRGRRSPEASKVELRLVAPEKLAVVAVEVY
jgi:hypothetical protein